MKTSPFKTFLNGLITENPTFVLLLGMCPTLAVTTGVTNAVGMGLSTTAVLICSNMVISLLRNFIPNKIRIASYIVIIAGFVTIVQMLMNAYVPALSGSLGIYIPLIVVNCIILGRAEAFASKNNVLHSAFDGLGMGLGFTCALILISSVREILGAGTFAGIPLFGDSFQPVSIMILPPGAFLTLGILLAIINSITKKIKNAKEDANHGS
ncbi:electron transport complex subunit RsxE [Ructibacterium gallinarum]|uniref:Ion-translocating oxidoreductase complex subunit E n=1 Tax=Ructibacterium gallinarum TaxID=2779355 RepID=A0A9D5M0H4_9FIRM|nr:electron transport complex subunit E [Ructibacterium gallinarum]MBE5040005.1 electron transport complex subunit E [Ructibacterium gallinarum]